MIRDVHPESRRILIFYSSRIPGSRGRKVPGSGSATLPKGARIHDWNPFLGCWSGRMWILLQALPLQPWQVPMCLFLNMIQRLERRPPDRRLAQWKWRMGGSSWFFLWRKLQKTGHIVYSGVGFSAVSYCEVQQLDYAELATNTVKSSCWNIALHAQPAISTHHALLAMSMLSLCLPLFGRGSCLVLHSVSKWAIFIAHRILVERRAIERSE